MIGAFVYLGWIFDIAVLKGLHPDFVAMNPLTAAAFILSGVTLWIHLSSIRIATRIRSVRFLGACIAAVGLLRILGVFGWDIEIDRALFSDRLGTNRMAPNTAIAFVLLGVSLSCRDLKSSSSRSISDLGAVGALLFGMVALTGYVYGVRTLYGVTGYIPMALNTGFTFILISLGILFTKPNDGLVAILLRKDFGGRMARGLLPAVILALLVLGWLELYGVRAGWFIPEVGGALHSVANMLIMIALVGWSAKSLSQSHSVFFKQKQILQSVLDGIGDGVVVGDSTGNFVLHNPAADRMSGIDRANADPGSWAKHFRASGTESILRSIKGEITNDVEFYVESSKGNEEIPVSVSSRPLFDEIGNPQGGVIVMRDVTERKKQEKTLRTTNEELEKKITERMNQLKDSENQIQQLQKMDAIGRLAGGVAHDFNNLLAAIKMYCDLLNDEPEKTGAVLENTREIKLVAERGAALTRQLLVFSRKQVVQYRPVDLNALIGNLKKMLDRLITENFTIHTELLQSLLPINADPGQIEQVIMNLVVNARDAMPGGGKITIESSNEGSHAVLAISDTGIGMDQATQSRIFEPFFTTKPVGKGTGLGLTTVYGIINQIKGTIRVESEPGKGTVFKVYFPSHASALTVPEPNVERASEVSAKPETETILLVEDEERLRDLFAAALRKHGYRVLVAENGTDALGVCERHPNEIHLLLTDVFMPGIGGFELAKKVEVRRPSIKVLYMSGYANEAFSERNDALNERIFYIQKPFDTRALIEKILEVRASPPKRAN